jgi:hypothetical protein
MKRPACGVGIIQKEYPLDSNQKKSYFEGLREGVWRYAWMKDGVYYVGTTGKTLKEALADIAKEEENN